MPRTGAATIAPKARILLKCAYGFVGKLYSCLLCRNPKASHHTVHVRTRASGGNAHAKQQARTVLVTVHAALGEISVLLSAYY